MSSQHTTSPRANDYHSYGFERSVVYLMVRNKIIYQRLVDAKFSDMGITSSQMNVLMTIADYKKTTASNISKILGVNPAATVRTIHKLESMNLIVKLKSMDDRRIIYLSLTN
jgi:MarR family transcriptional regulator, multiple antibiotic resistance protein MarR